MGSLVTGREWSRKWFKGGLTPKTLREWHERRIIRARIINGRIYMDENHPLPDDENREGLAIANKILENG
jgi:hypothetical protein